MYNIENKQLQINNKNNNSNVRLSNVTTDDRKYTQLDLSHSHFTTFNSGLVVPIYFEEVLPGDIFKIDLEGIIRMSAPATNTMTNPIFSINFFFCSYTSIFSKWKNLMGENPESGFYEETLNVPYINNVLENPQSSFIEKFGKYNENDLFNYLGYPSHVPNYINLYGFDMPTTIPKVSIMPCLAYGKIWNDWYRDQNLDDEIDITYDEENVIYLRDLTKENLDNLDYHKLIKYGFSLAPSSKLPDYFTTSLPFQQKGFNVTIGDIGQTLSNLYITNGNITDSPNNFFQPIVYGAPNEELPSGPRQLGTSQSKLVSPMGPINGGQSPAYFNFRVTSDKGNLFNSNININDLRNSLTLQHYLELDARFGTRYNEYLFSHWGILIDPLDINKSIMIGSYEDSLKISNVAQTSESTSNSPLGSLGGILQNYIKSPNSFNYASTQHGYIFGMITIRSPIFYSQGLSKKLTKVTKFDFFDPLFANISDQPIYNYEIYYNPSNDDVTNGSLLKTFGYNEAWAEYRYTLNRNSGFLSSNSPNSLKSLYLYGENYNTYPFLNINWMKYNPNIINNTLFKVQDNTTEFYNQFMANFNFNVKVDRKIPLYGVPGVQKV